MIICFLVSALTIVNFMPVRFVQGLCRLSKIEGLGGCSEFGSLQTLYGLAASQYGESREMPKEGEMVKDYVNRLFGYRHDHLPYAAGAVVGFTIHFASGFAFSIKVFNFQRR